MSRAALHGKKIVFYDGVCVLCSGAVHFIIRHDRRRRFLFAPLQGDTAKHMMVRRPDITIADPPSSIVYVRDFETSGEKARQLSSAVLHIMKDLGGGWFLLGCVLMLVPRIIRDPLYRLVAAHRYRWFGKRDTCLVPGNEEAARFLP